MLQLDTHLVEAGRLQLLAAPRVLPSNSSRLSSKGPPFWDLQALMADCLTTISFKVGRPARLARSETLMWSDLFAPMSVRYMLLRIRWVAMSSPCRGCWCSLASLVINALHWALPNTRLCAISVKSLPRPITVAKRLTAPSLPRRSASIAEWENPPVLVTCTPRISRVLALDVSLLFRRSVCVFAWFSVPLFHSSFAPFDTSSSASVSQTPFGSIIKGKHSSRPRRRLLRRRSGPFSPGPPSDSPLFRSLRRP